MLRNHGLRCAAVAAVALVLAGPVAPAHAAGRTLTGGSSIQAGVAALWDWAKTIFSPGPVAQLACDKGSLIDPNGGCTATASPAGGPTATPDSDAGSSIDPNGG